MPPFERRRVKELMDIFYNTALALLSPLKMRTSETGRAVIIWMSDLDFNFFSMSNALMTFLRIKPGVKPWSMAQI